MTFVVGISGKKGSGKDTAGKALCEKLGFKEIKFATPLKLMLGALLWYRGADEHLIERMLDGDLKEVPSPLLNGRTPRYAMQTLGTEWGRNLIHEDLWIDTFQDKAKTFDRVVNTDTRFPNEVGKIFDMDGIVIKVERDVLASGDEHPSEALVDTLTVDHIVKNNTSIEDFQAEIAALVEEELSREPKLPERLV